MAVEHLEFGDIQVHWLLAGELRTIQGAMYVFSNLHLHWIPF